MFLASNPNDIRKVRVLHRCSIICRIILELAFMYVGARWYSLLAVVGLELRVSCLLGMWFTTDLYSQFQYVHFHYLFSFSFFLLCALL